MSNLSDIGFPVQNESDVNRVLMDVIGSVEAVPCPPYGFYFCFEDPSGARIVLQANPSHELVGFNPSFSGKGGVTLEFLRRVERDTSPMDGGYVARSCGADTRYAEPFVFDVPEFRTLGAETPFNKEVELNAFASSDLRLVRSGEQLAAFSGDEGDPAGGCFVATGLDRARESEGGDHRIPPQAHIRMAADVLESEIRINEQTGIEFGWFFVDSPVGKINVLADKDQLGETPEEGSRIAGSFWLTGNIRNREEPA